MSTQQNKAIARQFVSLWGNGSLDIIDNLADASFSSYYPAFPMVIKGGNMFRKVIEGFRAAFSDLHCQVDEEIAENDKVVIRWSFSAMHTGDFLGYAATNKNVKWTGITIYRIINGKVVEERGEEDYLGYLRQIGAISKVN
jgi:predicted ester cyclase